MVQLNWQGSCDEWDDILEERRKKEYEEKMMNVNPSEAYSEAYKTYISKLNENNELTKDLVTSRKEVNLPWDDPVSHPAHYTSGKIECIDYIEDKQLGFHLGNAVKYITRAGKKSPGKKIEDLRKAMWYIDRYIQLEEQRERDEIKEMIGNRTE